MARFGAVLTAMVTPFADDGALDLGAAADLARWLVAHGNDGLVLAGTTGESPVLTDDERIALFESVRAAVDVPIVAGTTTNDTAHSVGLTRQATELGVDAILAVTPYYNRPSQAGLEAHFRAVAAATDLPVMLYDIPIRAGRKIAFDTLVRLADEVPNVVALKDAAGNPAETAALIAATPDDFDVYSGDDSFTLPLLAVGAVGAVGVATHWIGRETGELIAAFAAGDVTQARKINARLLSSYAYETSDDAPNPVPTKALLRAIGLPVGPCRLPMGPDPDGLDQRAQALIADLHLTR
ncbi:MAG TPA: 4-hydroxy-tetrahydrodipicolinate synthase [Acidimicrobiales bacterium]|jgi:4-hydroxy-tetrahydrodipicolinate synthase|nr:4-hydroxy-tetrahydrodipicolinate synthase [Acidimicrobiales bacterium]